MESTMKKLITTTALAVAAISTTSRSLDPPTPPTTASRGSGTDAAPGAWALGLVHRLVHQRRPARRPGRESGEDNLANLIQIGEGWSDTTNDAYRQNVRDA